MTLAEALSPNKPKPFEDTEKYRLHPIGALSLPVTSSLAERGRAYIWLPELRQYIPRSIIDANMAGVRLLPFVILFPLVDMRMLDLTHPLNSSAKSWPNFRPFEMKVVDRGPSGKMPW